MHTYKTGVKTYFIKKLLCTRNHTAWNDSMPNILKATEKALETSA